MFTEDAYLHKKLIKNNNTRICHVTHVYFTDQTEKWRFLLKIVHFKYVFYYHLDREVDLVPP